MSPIPRYAYIFLAAAVVTALLMAAGCLAARDAVSRGQGGSAAPANLSYYTMNIPPYSYFENGTPKGFALDLVVAVAAKAGQPVSRDQIRIVPWNWSEANRVGLTQNGSVLFVAARLPEREQSFKWVGPVAADHHVLFARSDSRITVRGPGDLRHYRIGVGTGDFGIQQLRDAGVNESRIATTSNVSTLIEMLERGEIDLWSSREMGGRYYAGQRGAGDSIRAVYAFDDDEGYLVFNRNTSDATVAAFQQALDGLKQERDAANVSAYDRIVEPYFPPAGPTLPATGPSAARPS